jgi:formylglycine-generating enzyme
MEREAARGDSPQGVSDLAGNVWEWTASHWVGKSFKSETESAKDYVLRGGSWDNDEPSWVEAGQRMESEPGYRHHHVGFRCVVAERRP